MSNLIIVESPNKIKKIKSFVGSDYIVSASCGHIRNMDPKCMSIEIDDTCDKFDPIYIVVSDKKKIVSSLKSDIKNIGSMGTVYLAMDYDREGEAIAWHLNEVLKLKSAQTKRITFTEITKKAILNSLKSPSQIDMNMFYSQQARMVLDKLIGYMISPILWKHFNNWKLSAGRVQSVVVKIVQEREDEIAKFKSAQFFKIVCDFWIDKKDLPNKKKAYLNTTLDNEIKKREEVDVLVKYVPHKETVFKVQSKKTSNSKRRPPPPFITSSLQQEASNKLSMSPKSTMSSAQKLYELGLITYMRTDSTLLSEDAHIAINKKVIAKFGEEYYKKTQYKSKSKSSQEAHEAVRPTHFEKETVLEENPKINSYDNRLYQLIWKRAVASQMKPAEVETTTVKVKLENSEIDKSNKDYIFTGKAEKILFDGYLKLYGKKTAKKDDEDDDNDEDNEKSTSSKNLSESVIKKIKGLKKDDIVFFSNFDALEKHSKPPKSRFTEASLIKRLDELEIGRPSTYASMATKVQTKLYVEKKTVPPVKKEFAHITINYPSEIHEEKKTMKVDGEKNKLFVTPLGFMLNEYLNKQFANILDYGFTAKVESLLDEISKGNKVWNIVVGEVYKTFNPTVEKLNLSFKKSKMIGGSTKHSDMETIELGDHPESGIPIIVMNTRYGPAVVLNHSDKTMRKYANFTGSLKSITLEKAISMLQYPKTIGTYEKSNVIINKRKNYYITHKKKNYSIDIYNKSNENKEGFELINGEVITIEEAIEVIKFVSANNGGANDINITDNIVIKKGPYGFYIKYEGKTNIPLIYKYKKTYDTFEKMKTITLEECQECIEKYKAKKQNGDGKPNRNFKKKK